MWGPQHQPIWEGRRQHTCRSGQFLQVPGGGWGLGLSVLSIQPLGPLLGRQPAVWWVQSAGCTGKGAWECRNSFLWKQAAARKPSRGQTGRGPGRGEGQCLWLQPRDPGRSQGDRAAKERERPLHSLVLCMKYLDSRADELSPPFAEV